MDFVLALYLSLLIMNVIVLLFLMFATNRLLMVMRIPDRFLGMLILILGFVGVYTLRNSITDCFIAAIFGLFGVILHRLKLPFVPIILGMILGGIMESRLRVAMARIDSPLDFINRPISAVLFFIIVVVVVLSLVSTLTNFKAQRTLLKNKSIPMRE